MSERFLVTGALGAVGVWTLRSLLERGHEVVALDVGSDAHRLPLALDAARARDVIRVRADITDLEAVERVMDGYAVGGVIHLAALQVPFVREDPVLGAKVNVTGTVNVLEAVRRRADRISTVVYASSIAVYGIGGTLAHGDAPGTLYGTYKRANEATALRFFEDYGVSSIGLRPHTIYGPGRDQGVTSGPTAAMLAAAAERPFQIPYQGDVLLQYAPDVGEAFARAAELEHKGADTYDLNGASASIEEVIRMIEQAAPAVAGRITASGEPLPFPSAIDGSAFVELLGGSVMRPLEDGVADAVNRFRALLAAEVIRMPD